MNSLLDLEEWQDVEGYVGLYQVSHDGCVRRLVPLLPSAIAAGQRRPSHILRQGSNRQGRAQVTLCKNGIPKRFLVHRLVLIAFKGPPPFDSAEARHRDGNHRNNDQGNLEWGTHQQNMWDKDRHGTQLTGSRQPNAKLDENCVREIRKSDLSGRELAKLYGVSQVAIHSIKARKTWKHVE